MSFTVLQPLSQVRNHVRECNGYAPRAPRRPRAYDTDERVPRAPSKAADDPQGESDTRYTKVANPLSQRFRPEKRISQFVLCL